MVPDAPLAVYRRSLGLDPTSWLALKAAITRCSPSPEARWCPWFLVLLDRHQGGRRLDRRLGAAAAIAVGGMLGYLAGANVAWSATRQLLALAVAAAATWGAGRLFNVTVT